MNRYFVALLLLLLGLFVVTMVLGLQLPQDRQALALEQRPQVRTHLLLGLVTAVVGMLVHGIVITYFVGTSRWCREVTETYRLEPDCNLQSQQLKRRTFPVTLAAMLSLVVLVALGAASDPTSQVSPEAFAGLRWSDLHLAAAFLVLGLQAVAAWFQWTNIVENQRVIRRLVEQVQAIRRAKGLDD